MEYIGYMDAFYIGAIQTREKLTYTHAHTIQSDFLGNECIREMDIFGNLCLSLSMRISM